MPVVVHLLANAPDNLSTMITRLEGLEGVAGIEAGFPDWAEKNLVEECLDRLSSELPVIARVPLSRVLEFANWLDDPVRLTAISIGPARGALRADSGQILEGRLYGPSVYPQVLHTVKVLSSLRVPVLAGGGIYREEQLEALLRAGAAAVQLDSVLWKGGF
jgi:dihydroorotate dehydrogenase (NAD+) catalytic subunit